ncbi:acyltransferase [Pedobacter psychrophilus]|uniref:acyltransferase n=1 Tax=Pedobacter psychrophilus TaxID=1826909 RepID=UPI0009EF0663|nr:hypothetical protein [Pedobacter psychrophilus]
MRGLKSQTLINTLNTSFTWPHKVSIGKNVVLESNLYFKCDGPYSEGLTIILKNNVFIGFGCEFNIRKLIEIGDNCLIGSGCKFIDMIMAQKEKI